MKIKKVKWRDSQIYSYEEKINEKRSVAIIESVGFVIEDTKDYIILTRDYLNEETVRGTIVIPKENIIK